MLIVDLLAPLFRALWRMVNVWRQAPDEAHTPTEYADAFLFPAENPHATESSSPLSILAKTHR
jgi:hypothetical protein